MDDPFIEHRSLLFTIAYEMLSSAADAEDVVQETWLRWADVDHSEVREPRAYLVRIVTRQSLNRMRALARRRETYVGPWLPEPLLNAPVVEGRTWLATVDFLWPRHRLVVEYYGGHHFRSDEQRLGDLHRVRRLRDHGYRVEEITRLDLREPDRVVARVSTALADQERLLRLV